ncbi:MAG: aminoglycoside/hydroxyurea antibiotic resistance kinase [Myxococcales bacterium]|nr:aminoglycoside/hydroxyurea antibiotic resistance kinase [Myxococcales bacterium]
MTDAHPSTLAVAASVPDTLKRCLAEIHGADASARWLTALPKRLEALSRAHGLIIEPVRHRLSYNLVLPVTYRGRRAVLKMSVPNPELEREVCAVRACQGRAMVRCLEASPDEGWALLEALEPGTTLHDEPEALAITAAIIHELHQSAPPASLPHLARWAGGFERLRAAFGGGTGPFAADLVRRAEAIFAARARPAPGDVLLHGDLHHGNILRDGHGWRAIDPKGLRGPRGFEPTAFMRNALDPEMTDARLRDVLASRVEGFARHLGVERAELVEWGIAQAVLSAIWMWEDHGEGWAPELWIARAFEGLR